MKEPKRKCFFFDRDGIVNVPPEEGGYVCRPQDFLVIPEFLETLQLVEQAGYDAVIITNQQGVGKGLYTEQILDSIHQKLRDQIHRAGLNLLAIYYCPHLASVDCECRKPKPGMLLQAAREWDIDLSASWMVGDSFRDIEAGAYAGCRTLLVSTRDFDRATACVRSIEELPHIVEQEIIKGGRGGS